MGQRGIQIQLRWRRATDSVATTVAKSAGGRECLARKVVTVASSPDLNRVLYLEPRVCLAKKCKMSFKINKFVQFN